MTSDVRAGFGPDPAEAAAVAEQFGVAAAQVERDHLISHVLAALAPSDVADRLTFFGGTALSRTLLPLLRLSEDIDLIAAGSRSEAALAVTAAIRRGLARTHGRVTWTPELGRTAGAVASVLAVEGTALRIQVQLLSDEGYPRWPTKRRQIHQRFADAPAATLRTLTPSAFVASKLAAWHDRRAPRDLFDLWGRPRPDTSTPGHWACTPAWARRTVPRSPACSTRFPHSKTGPSPSPTSAGSRSARRARAGSSAG